MNNTRVVISVGSGQIRPAKLNDVLKAAGFTFDGSHNAQEAIVQCDPADEAAIRALIATHLSTDWVAQEAAENARAAAIDGTITQDAVIQNIKGMTNAEYDAWWSANVTNAAQAIGVLKRVVRILCRRVL